MQTAADDLRDSTRESITEAIKNLAEIVIDKVYGHDDYTEEYKNRLTEVLIDLIKIANKLDGNL